MAGKDTTRWYSAMVVLKALRPPPGRRKHLWEHTVLLVRAHDEDAARLRAWELAKQHEVEYRNADGEVVRWVRVRVDDVKEVAGDPAVEGTEVWSSFSYRVDPRRADG
jgi:PAS domain-containing protein